MSKPRSATDGATKVTAQGAKHRQRSRYGWVRRAPLGALLLAIVLVLVTAIAFGATRPNTGRPPAPLSGSPSQPIGLPSVQVGQPELVAPPDLPELDARIAAIEAKYDVLVGITLSQVASYPVRTQQTWYGGTLRSGPALATIDVAMALAIIDGEKQPLDRNYMFNRALADDSAAADAALWAFLGDPEEAAALTTQALRVRGDWATVVPFEDETERLAPYLRTNWDLDAQSQLMGALICDQVEAYPVLSKLNDPAEEPWGLQTTPLSYSKGATGEMGNGSLLVRQFGLIRLADGTQLGIAMAVSTTGDDADDGRDAITELANAVRRLATGFEPRSC